MHNVRLSKLLGILLSCVLTLSCLAPSAALAGQTNVHVDGQGNADSSTTQVSKVTVGDVRAPSAGEELDDTAQVDTAEGVSWTIPVLWVDSSANVVTRTVEGQRFLPVLAFFVPDDISVKDSAGGFEVFLTDDLAALFGDEEIISVFDDSTGITFIMPASIRFFLSRAAAREGSNANELPYEDLDDEVLPEEREPEEQDPAEPEAPESRDIVDIYCAQTAKDVLSHEDLAYLIDLIINKLEPQAVNLLLEKFPAFKAAADRGEIGTEISLYIYYKNGDEDGIPEHESIPAALACVLADFHISDGVVRYGYMIGVDVDTLTERDSSGRLVLKREGEDFNTFQNTIVHELFHALMDDYNRTGMVGATGPENATIGTNLTPAQRELYLKIRYPQWFIEGTASAVENIYSFRSDVFELLTQDYTDKDGQVYSGLSFNAIFHNYLSPAVNDKQERVRLGLTWAEDTVDNDGVALDSSASRYVSGYLATLYLGELAARSNADIGTSFVGENALSSERIRMGLNSIFERMHNGETLDQVIASISPQDANGKLYTSTDDFAQKFIVGSAGADGNYQGDASVGASLEFVSRYLTYMDAIQKQKGNGRTYDANGSILFDFERDYVTPLEPTKNDSSDTLRVIEKNDFHNSTVSDSVALAGGGKSMAGSKGTAAAASEASVEQPVAAQESAKLESATPESVVRESATSESAVRESATPESVVRESATQPAAEQPVTPAPIEVSAPATEPALEPTTTIDSAGTSSPEPSEALSVAAKTANASKE